ncbi:MAG: single-stranded DNA-binding protein [Desulfomonile sp.]|nr:single-stranded DNA-binding protein [Desulfomonile sp.]
MAPRSLNKVLLLGHVGKDPEVRYTGSGRAVASFTLATSQTWKDQEGNDQERTEWHRIVAWGRLGEICGEYLSKGKQVFIEGRIQSRDWEDQEGNKRTTVEIIASDMIMLGGGGPSQAQREDREPPPRSSRRPEPKDAGVRRPERRYEPPPPEDDIPF